MTDPTDGKKPAQSSGRRLSGAVAHTLGRAILQAIMRLAMHCHATMRFGAGVARPLLIAISLILTGRLLADPANPLTRTVLTALS